LPVVQGRDGEEVLRGDGGVAENVGGSGRLSAPGLFAEFIVVEERGKKVEWSWQAGCGEGSRERVFLRQENLLGSGQRRRKKVRRSGREDMLQLAASVKKAPRGS